MKKGLTPHIGLCDPLCGGEIMATNLQLDDRLIKEAVVLGEHRTKKAAVTQALTDYIRHLRQERILDLFGRVDFDPRYDYKRQRTKA
jgi:Arc/MetJ family transcription regulator